MNSADLEHPLRFGRLEARTTPGAIAADSAFGSGCGAATLTTPVKCSLTGSAGARHRQSS
jgi:hypothetical protein